MASTHNVRKWYEAYRCHPGVERESGFFGRHPVYEQKVSHDAVTALEMAHPGSGYVPENDGWIGSKRNCPRGLAGALCQEDGRGCSIHNYCLAYDIEYNYNRWIRAKVIVGDFDEDWFPWVCKYTLAQVRAIEGIKNIFGEQMWLWLGWLIGDFMHWQINVPPERLEVDWNTVPGYEVDDGMTTTEPDAWAKLSWEKADKAGAISPHSLPRREVSAQMLMVFLDRLGLLDPQSPIGRISYVTVVRDVS